MEKREKETTQVTMILHSCTLSSHIDVWPDGASTAHLKVDYSDDQTLLFWSHIPIYFTDKLACVQNKFVSSKTSCFDRVQLCRGGSGFTRTRSWRLVTSSSLDTFPSLQSYSRYCLVLDYFLQNGSGLTCQDTFAKKVRTEGNDAVFGSMENAI